MIDAGIGETQLNSVLTGLNISELSTSSLKRYERTVGRAIKALAEKTCSKNLELEKKLTNEANDVVKDE